MTEGRDLSCLLISKMESRVVTVVGFRRLSDMIQYIFLLKCRNSTLSLFCSLIFCILVIRLEVGCSCCSCCRGALHHNLLLTTRNSTLLISQCGGVLVPGPHWVFGVGLSFNCIVKLINWYISIVFILIGLLNKNICNVQMFVKKDIWFCSKAIMMVIQYSIL